MRGVISAMGRTTRDVLGVPIDAIAWSTATDRILTWAGLRESRFVCICNVHVVVTASRDCRYLETISAADMATPDGMPVAWALRRMGYSLQQRINGPDLMWKLCEGAATGGLPVFFYGSSDETLCGLRVRLLAAFPGLRIAGMESPPFRPLSEAEDAADVVAINASGAGIVFVSLGCPKQEKWMAAHRGRINAVMIGVGAAFDYHAGTLKRAPEWMQNCGLEWLFRFVQEPRRLWRRYLVTNTLFVAGIARQLLSSKAARGPKGGHE